MTKRSEDFKRAKDEADRLPEVKFINPELAMIILKSIPTKEYNNGEVVNTLKFVLLALLQDGIREMDKESETLKERIGDMDKYSEDKLEDWK